MVKLQKANLKAVTTWNITLLWPCPDEMCLKKIGVKLLLQLVSLRGKSLLQTPTLVTFSGFVTFH